MPRPKIIDLDPDTKVAQAVDIPFQIAITLNECRFQNFKGQGARKCGHALLDFGKEAWVTKAAG